MRTAMLEPQPLAAKNSAARPQPLLNVDAEIFRTNFNRQPFLLRHHLTDHALFTLPRLIELARRLPADRVEYNSGALPLTQDPQATPLNGLSITETIRRIEECRSWMVLKNVEQDAAYRDLLDCCLDQIQPLTEAVAPQMFKREAYIFISSPEAVTPYHIDNEYNFLLQLRGQKTVAVFPANERRVLSDIELENFYGGGHRNLVFQEEYEHYAALFQLRPGSGLHFPLTAPHWVKNGAEVSISFSITFRSLVSEQREAVHRVNGQLRKWGLPPTAYGRSAWRDAAKSAAFRLWRRVSR